jgi:ribosomal protein S18 acetylase RimI-like enzyme
VATTIRRFESADADRLVELSLAAWEPVFASFHTMLGERLYRRVHPDWRTDQSAAVREALDRNETWVAVTDGTVNGFVNVIFNYEERSAEIYMIAVDPWAQRRGVATMLTERALSEMTARRIDLAIVATGGDAGHAPARATYEKAGFIGAPQVWYAKILDERAAEDPTRPPPGQT